MKKDFKEKMKELMKSKKGKWAMCHGGAAAAMALGLYLAPLPLMSEYMRLCGAMFLGAYCLKPLADWAYRKLS